MTTSNGGSRLSYEDVILALDAHEHADGHASARCPLPDHGADGHDRTPSLSISRDQERGFVVRCHAGCDQRRVFDAVVAAVRRSGPPRVTGYVEHLYRDENGKVVDVKVRRLGHRPRDKPKCWWKGGRKHAAIPYRLDELIAAVASGQRVYVVEGEGDADALTRRGLVATSPPDGAERGQRQRWHATWNEYFAGADVVVVADADDPGIKLGNHVVQQLRQSARAVRALVLHPDGGQPPPRGYDTSDWLAEGGTIERMAALADATPVGQLLDPIGALGSSAGDRHLATVQAELGPTLPPPEPGQIPSDLLQVPGFIGWFVQDTLSSAHRRQPELALAAAIAAMSLLAGRVVRGPTGIRPNVYLLCVAPSATGKQAGVDAAKETFLRAGCCQGMIRDAFASAAAMLSALADHQSILWCGDEIGETLAAAAGRDAGHMRGIRTILLQLFSCRNYDYGKGYKSEEDVVAVAPCLSVLGLSTPATLRAGITPKDVTEGLLGRCFVFGGEARPERGTLIGRFEPREELLQHCRRWMALAESIRGRTEDGKIRAGDLATVQYSEEAEARLQVLDQEVEEELGQACEDGARARLGRVLERVHQLALLYAASDDPECRMMTAEAVSWASRVVRHCDQRAAVLVYGIGSSRHEEARNRVYTAVERRGGRATKRQITRAVQSLDRRTREDALRDLVDSEALFCRQESVDQGNRVAAYYTIQRWREILAADR